MAYFVVEIRYVPEKFAEVRPRHREFLQQQVELGTVVVAGPLDNDTGGMVVFRVESREALQDIIDSDPYHLEGVVAERTVREFKPVLGAWVPPGS